MKAFGEVDVWIHVFLTSALVAGEWLVQAPAALPPGKVPPELRNRGRPARSQSP
jgi:hypothetical protein